MTEKNIIEIVPKELLTNLLGPSTKSIGEGLGGVFNFVMLPLRKLNVITDRSYNQFSSKINNKTENIPLDNRDNSKLGLALKATEDSKYQLNEEILRNQFANLIANTLDSRVNEIITPRFSNVLSQLSVSDATMLDKIVRNNSCVAAKSVRFQNTENKIGINPFNFFLIYFDGSFENGAESFDTLMSLGIIKNEMGSLSEQHYFNCYRNFDANFKTSVTYKNYIEEFQNFPYNPEIPGNEIVFYEGSIKLTDFGRSFCKVVIDQENP